MNDESQAKLQLQMQELERDKLQEELKQLKESAKQSWIAPTVWLAALPLLGGFGLWMVGEMKQYNEAYQALADVDNYKKEKADLKKEKADLHGEIQTLLLQKADYAATSKDLEEAVAQQQQKADRLSKEVADRQKDVETLKQNVTAQTAKLDQFYLQIAFANAETRYALGHITASPTADPKALKQIRDDLKSLSEDEARKIDELLRDYQFAFEMSKDVDAGLKRQSQDIQKTAVSAWARELEWGGPRGSMMQGRSIMVTKGPGERRYYDVELGKFVPKEKVKD